MKLNGLIENNIAKFGESRVVGFSRVETEDGFTFTIDIDSIKEDDSNYCLITYKELREAAKVWYK